MKNSMPLLFPNSPQGRPLEQSLKLMFNELKYYPENVQRLIQEIGSKAWVADHPSFNLLETVVEIPSFNDCRDDLWGQIMDYLIHHRQSTVNGEQAFAWLLKITQGKMGEGKSVPLWDAFFETFSREQKMQLLSAALSADYRIMISKLLPAIENPVMTEFKPEENPYVLAKTLALVNDLNSHGFSLLDFDSNGKMGVEILRERSRHSFENYKERDAIVKRMMEVEGEMPPERRFEIAIKTAKKWSDIQFALKFFGSDWMKYSFGKNNDIHPLHLVAHYQPSYLINVLQRKEVREAGSSWLEQDQEKDIPFWIPLLCSGHTKYILGTTMPALQRTIPQLFSKTMRPPVVLLWEYVVKTGVAFPIDLGNNKNWLDFSLSLSQPSSFDALFRIKKDHPGFGAELEQQILTNVKIFSGYNHDHVFMGLGSSPVKYLETVPQLVNLQILELVTRMQHRNHIHGTDKENEKIIDRISHLLEHQHADWQKVDSWLKNVVPSNIFVSKFDQWENSLKSNWEIRQLRIAPGERAVIAAPRRRL